MIRKNGEFFGSDKIDDVELIGISDRGLNAVSDACDEFFRKRGMVFCRGCGKGSGVVGRCESCCGDAERGC